MDVSQVKAKKEELEKEISRMLLEFSNETDTVVESVRIVQRWSDSKIVDYLIELDVAVG